MDDNLIRMLLWQLVWGNSGYVRPLGHVFLFFSKKLWFQVRFYFKAHNLYN